LVFTGGFISVLALNRLPMVNTALLNNPRIHFLLISLLFLSFISVSISTSTKMFVALRQSYLKGE
jgi:hypothetical protein